MNELIQSVMPYTDASVRRVKAMLKALRLIDSDSIAGDIVECGVRAGGHIILARHASPDRLVWLYDTFEGMTEPGPFDVSRGGTIAHERWLERGKKWADVSLDQVKINLLKTQSYDERFLRFVKGPVEQTLLDPSNLPETIALLRLDTDWYESTKIELEVLWPLVAVGGYMIVDDYGHWLGARKAVDEYFVDKGRPATWTQIDYTGVIMRKAS